MGVVVINNIKHPYCGFEDEFKLLKTWRYSAWSTHYECSRYAERLGFYLDPSGRCKSFTVKFKPRAGEARREALQSSEEKAIVYRRFDFMVRYVDYNDGDGGNG
jgi:hypothetical protein